MMAGKRTKRHRTAGATRASLRAGFTLTEVMIAMSIMGLAMASALGSFFYVNRAERLHAVQGHLDVDARMVVERLRRDLWFSARDQVVLFPPGPGPYTAVSFPVSRNFEPDQPVPLDADGRIEWDTTRIYHLWDGPPAQLRITTFSPRVEMTPEERLEQLAAVVEAGSGQHALNGDAASTRVLITNLVEWELNITRARFDGYASIPGRRNLVGLGSAVLQPGPQQYMFRVVDRHPDSNGFQVGVDTLTVSPTGLAREGEAQYPVFDQSGGVARVEYVPGGVWSGNHLLHFSASEAGAHFTLEMDHDRWEEHNFLATGARLDRTEVMFDQSFQPHAYTVHLAGKGRTWEASAQTGDLDGAPQTESALTRSAVRVVMRGSELLNGGWIDFEGQHAWVGFRSAGEDRRLRLLQAFIAECADPSDATRLMDFKPGTEQVLTFADSSSVVVSAARESDRADFTIEREKNYMVGFLVQHEGFPSPHGYAWVWTPPEGVGGFPSSFRIPAASDPGIEDLMAPAWSGRDDLIASSAVFAVAYVYTGHPAEGTYTSQVVDTQIEDPAFESLDWNAVVPPEADLEIRARAGSEPDLSDAADWEALLPLLPGQRPPMTGRYVQVQARLTPGVDSLTTPQLTDFTLAWEGEPRVVDIAGSFSTGPDHGIFEVLVNGAPLFHGVTVDLTVFRDLSLGREGHRRLTASVFSEIVPRNTGR